MEARTTSLLFLITLIMATYGSIQIMDLSQNPGLVIISAGESFMKVGEHRIYHTIDFDLYQPTFTKFKAIIKELRTFGNFTELNDIISAKLDNLRNIYFGLRMKTRQKRGLINFVGSGIKFLTGNMDHEDYIEISRDLDDLKSQNNNLVRENNQQRKINFDMQDRINKLIKQLNYQQSLIVKNLNNAQSNNNLQNQIQLLEKLVNVNIQLDHLISHFKDVSESIHLAKLNLISKHILQPDELSFSIEKLEEKGIIIDNIEQVYDFLEISAFYNMSKLVFVIKIPSIEKVTYNHLILEPIPVENKIMKLPSNTAMISENSTYFITKDCRQIEGHRICTKNSDVADFSNDTCFSKLLRGMTGTCVFERFNNSKEIRQVTTNHIVVKSKLPVKIETNCGITSRNLSGSFLIQYRNCSINLDSTTFENTEIIRRELPLIIPLDGLQITQQVSEKPIENLHIINRNHLETISHRIQYSSISLSVLSILGIISLIILYMFKSKNINITFHKGQQSAKTVNESTTDHSLETKKHLSSKYPVMETSFLSTRDVSTSQRGVVTTKPFIPIQISKPSRDSLTRSSPTNLEQQINNIKDTSSA